MIETERILDPQFNDAVVFLTGAQIEMLRNVTQYLNRLDTYVSEQFLGYYLAPTVEDYDSILEIVADLEETLMGNENVIFGYNAVLQEFHNVQSDVNDDFVTSCAQVPEGEVWRVTGLSMMRSSEAPKIMLATGALGGDSVKIGFVEPEKTWSYYPIPVDMTMSAEHRIIGVFEGAVIDEWCRISYWGYKMKVP